MCRTERTHHHEIGIEASRGLAAEISFVTHRVSSDGILAGRVPAFWLSGAGGQDLSHAATCSDAGKLFEQALG